jgi:GTP cyclohydrolase II
MSSPPRRKLVPSKHARTQQMESSLESVPRAVDALRRGVPVVFEGAEPFAALAVETARDATLGALKATKRAPALLVLTHARARTLKIRLYTPDVVAVIPDLPLNAAELLAIADPTDDLSTPLKGPFETVREKLPPAYGVAIKLAKLAGLLPAVVVRPGLKPSRQVVRVSASDVLDYEKNGLRTLHVVTRARVPLGGAEQTELVSFRADDGGPEHYAIVIGRPQAGKPVLTRLHSECFTGDLLGSLKCDCGAQLRGAVEAIAKDGSGVLLYLAQEGRGIGLVNKLRAYRLQDQGFDTLEANERLGFQADERLYGVAARMLELLGIKSVRLMTNNPDKVTALKSAGVTVAKRVPHAFPDNEHNRAYLRTKADKAGHLL